MSPSTVLNIYSVAVRSTLLYGCTSIHINSSNFKNLLSGFKITLSLTARSQQNLAKNVTPILLRLMFNLPRFRNSWTDLYRQRMVEKQRFLAFY